MKNRKGLFVLALLIVLALIVYLNRGRINFDWHTFLQQLHLIRWKHIILAIALIYSTYFLRSIRWSVFVAPTKKVSPFALIGSQFIGFTAVALFGRPADLTRPYLIAKRIQLPISSQIAVYTIERMFDLGAAALIFSGALFFAPASLPHHEVFAKASRTSLIGTSGIAIFAVIIRVAGAAVARTVSSVLGGLSKPLAESVADRILEFRDGLNAIGSAKDFLIATLLSLAMWGLIGLAYVETLHAFVSSPELANITYAPTMLLMAASIVASLLQLPIIGWFTQITATAWSMHEFFSVPLETATACGALLLLVTFLSIIPAGLLFARIERISLKTVTTESASESPARVPQ